jgi:hypothetical protein
MRTIIIQTVLWIIGIFSHCNNFLEHYHLRKVWAKGFWTGCVECWWDIMQLCAIRYCWGELLWNSMVRVTVTESCVFVQWWLRLFWVGPAVPVGSDMAELTEERICIKFFWSCKNSFWDLQNALKILSWRSPFDSSKTFEWYSFFKSGQIWVKGFEDSGLPLTVLAAKHGEKYIKLSMSADCVWLKMTVAF